MASRTRTPLAPKTAKAPKARKPRKASKASKATKPAGAGGELVFVTGATGFIGGYVLDWLLRETDVRLAVLTRARTAAEGHEKLWRALQLHMGPGAAGEARFLAALPRFEIVTGDLTAPDLGIAPETRSRLIAEVGSVLHMAASLNRKSAKACLNHNLRGTLSVVRLARAIADDHPLRRFSHVSTTAVAGHRDAELVGEDEAIDWDRSDYDPYARTKKFCEHMVRELLPDVPKTFFRPSSVLGDSRFPDTTQFDMVRAYCFFADLPMLPFGGHCRQDIVPADFVGPSIADLHTRPSPKHETYHLSSGAASLRADEITRALAAARTPSGRPPRFVPALERPFRAMIDAAMAVPAKNQLTMVASLLKVFLPYVTFDTVFDNTRVTSERGVTPAPFTDYCAGLYRFAKANDFAYPYRPYPLAAKTGAAAPSAAAASSAKTNPQEAA